MADLAVIVDAIMVLFAAFIAAFSWGVYMRYRELSGGPWLPVSFAFMFLNRVFVLADAMLSYPAYPGIYRLIASVFFFLFSGILLYSLWRIKNEGDELLRTDKQAMKSIAEFESRRKRRKK